MAKNIYALLVGIDNYHPASNPPVRSLAGCINDIKAIETYLRDRIDKVSEWTLVEPRDVPWILTNEQATRHAIINGFQQHLCKADSEDVVLFYYAGHGSQQKVPEAFSHLELDQYNETLISYDSRTNDNWDIADKELAYLISQVSKNNPHTVVILDCCHSGTGTRDVETVRQAASDGRQRPWDSFIFANDSVALNELASINNQDNLIKLQGFKGNHIAIAACRSNEKAKEYIGEDGQPRGAFSYFLTETLKKTNGGISYRDLVRNVSALAIGQLKEQSPQIEATNTEELNQPFLGGAIGERPQYFTLSYNKKYSSWVIDSGALHGIPKSSKGGDTLLAIFPLGSSTEELHQLNNAIAEAKVTQVLPARSKVEIICDRNRGLSENQAYWAVITSVPLAPLKVYIQGDTGEETGVELANLALLAASPNQKPSLYVDAVDSPQDAYCTLLARNGQYSIIKDNRSLVAPIPEQPSGVGYTSDLALRAIQRLEHIARWNNILTLDSPATSFIKSEQVEMSVQILSGQEIPSSPDGIEKRVQYTFEGGEWKPPVIQVKLTNNSSRTLFCNLLELSESYGVYLPFFEERSSIVIHPYTSIENHCQFYIPDAFLQQGVTEYKEIFKLIVSTTEFDAGLLEQDGLNPPQQTRSLALQESTLNLLLNRVNTREPGVSSQKLDDWMTKKIVVTIVRPHSSIQIQPNQSTNLLDGVVQLRSHPSLQAKVSLTTLPQVSRDIGEKTLLPPILLQDPNLIQPFQFTSTRGSDPGLGVLELFDIEDSSVVTKEAPLKLLVNTTLEEDEYILPVSNDGEFFLPLGKGERTQDGKVEIRLERLPNPTENSRSLQGSIRILFQKILNQKLKSPYDYPRLAIADIKENGTVIYENNREKVKAQVAQSNRIVLYIHGIIGDTASMLPSVQKAAVEMHGQEHSLKEVYDLILAFDYENLNTTIEENALLLKRKLAEVGLEANHEKELHIVAHSMGGLVSRWFIEREGGNQIVQHLVMLGTPNAGSPWSTVQNWAFAMLGVALNQLSSTIWPAKVVANLLELLEANDNSLEQMQAESEFLKELAENPDPHVAYTIIAGNRSINPDALRIQPKNQSSKLQRLMKKLFGQAVDKIVNRVFFEQPNDIAVSLKSIKSVSSERVPQPKILQPDTACDHLTYFTNPAGLSALVKTLT